MFSIYLFFGTKLALVVEVWGRKLFYIILG